MELKMRMKTTVMTITEGRILVTRTYDVLQ